MDSLPTDRVYEAYFGAMGEYLSVATRERIHWLCERANGSKILDVGCSQGISSIILGREGKRVDGIDIDERAISFAKEKLLLESPDVQKRVNFSILNFLDSDIEPGSYNIVILSELLEHLLDPQLMIKKVAEILPDGGKLLISVPFGINDSPDHKRTYYGAKLVGHLIKNGFFIEDKIVIKNSWLCFECSYSKEKTIAKTEDFLKIIDWLEICIQNRERMILEDKVSLVVKVKDLQDSIKKGREIENQLQVAIRDINNLGGRIERTENIREKSQKLEEDLKNSNLAKNDLLNQLRIAEIRSKDLEIIIQSSIKTNEELENKSKDLQTIIDAKAMDVADLTNKLNAVNQKYGQGMQAYEKLKADNADLTNKLNAANHKYSQGMQAYEKLKADNADLTNKLNAANQKYSQGIQAYEKLKADNAEIVSTSRVLIDRLNKELYEEQRILEEYSRLKKDRDKLHKKWNDFVHSRTGKIINSVWKIYNKIIY